MTATRNANQTSVHTVTITIDVNAVDADTVEDFILELAGQVEHHAHYNQSLSATNIKGSYTL